MDDKFVLSPEDFELDELMLLRDELLHKIQTLKISNPQHPIATRASAASGTMRFFRELERRLHYFQESSSEECGDRRDVSDFLSTMSVNPHQT